LLIACAFACAAGPALAAQPIPVVNEGGIRDKWMLAPGTTIATPAYPQAFVRRNDEVCIAVGYLLNADGTTSDYALLRAWTSAGEDAPEPGYWSAFAEAAGDALKQWRFQPRPEVAMAQPVYTVGTFVFGMHGASTALRQRCVIPNLVARLRELKAAARRPGGILPRLDLGPEAGVAYRREGGDR
jgi:hypothetical protein